MSDEGDPNRDGRRGAVDATAAEEEELEVVHGLMCDGSSKAGSLSLAGRMDLLALHTVHTPAIAARSTTTPQFLQGLPMVGQRALVLLLWATSGGS